jgi:glycosyltransferase involved in cell wall biosynthesis
VVVGSNYRDFDLLTEIIQNSPDKISFDVIGVGLETRERFADFQNVTVHKKLSIEEYGRVLRSAFIMLLPLSYATANNALLEAYNYGLPAFCSDIPGITDYAIDGTFFFRSSEEFWKLFKELSARSPDEYHFLASKIFEEGKTRFDWIHLSKMLFPLYKSKL